MRYQENQRESVQIILAMTVSPLLESDKKIREGQEWRKVGRQTMIYYIPTSHTRCFSESHLQLSSFALD